MSQLSALHAAIAAVCPINGVRPLAGGSVGPGNVAIDFAASATGPQQTAANSALSAFVWTAGAQATRDAQAAKTAANNSIDNGALIGGVSLERLIRSVALVTMDEINILRAAVPHPIVSINRVTTVATVVTPAAHGLSVGDPIAVAGADVAGYNLAVTVASIVNTTSFTYAMANSGTSPATGSLSYTLGAVPATPPRVASQIVTAIKAKIAATAE